MDYVIKETDFPRLFLFLNEIKGIHTDCQDSLFQFLKAVAYVLRSGTQWRLLPQEYGHWNKIYRRFKRWSDRGIWEQIFTLSQSDGDSEYVSIDSTIVRAHACSAGLRNSCQEEEALGRSKGGFSTKIHAAVDALGLPLKFILTPGQRNDCTQAIELTEEISGVTVIADKGYDSDAIIQQLAHQDCAAVIPPKRNRKIPRIIDRYLYKERHVIECCFGKLKHYRRIFSRFDKSASAFMSFLCFAGTLLWLR